MHRDTFHVGPDSGIGKHCNRDYNETPTKELETAIDFGILLLETVMRGNKVTASGDYRHFPLLPEGWREDIVGQRTGLSRDVQHACREFRGSTVFSTHLLVISAA